MVWAPCGIQHHCGKVFEASLGGFGWCFIVQYVIHVKERVRLIGQVIWVKSVPHKALNQEAHVKQGKVLSCLKFYANHTFEYYNFQPWIIY